MGGFTSIRLKDTSAKNIRKQNEVLKSYGVAKQYRFYSEDDIKFEYDGFVKGLGYFPEHQFPKDKIKSYKDFKKYWNPKAIGETFCPKKGALTFDCYYGRTSQRALRNIGKYVADNHNLIGEVSGSFSTFIERGMTRIERLIIKDSNISF